MDVTGLSSTELILELANAEEGGNHVTDAIGYYAYRRGYAGAVFYSARVMNKGGRKHIELTSRVLAEAFLLDMMKLEMGRMCIVLFSGPQLVRSIQRYSFDGEDWVDNPYFGATAEDIAMLSKYSETCRVVWMKLPAPIVPWTPSEGK
jgi:hypothetical protein